MSSHLVIDPGDFPSQNVHMSAFAVGTHVLLAMNARRDVRFFRTHAAAFHRLSTRWIRQLSGDFYVKLQETLQSHVGRVSLDAVVRYPVFRPAFRTFHLRNVQRVLRSTVVAKRFCTRVSGHGVYLSPDVVHQAVHTRFHAKRMLTWQQFRIPVPVQTYRARQQLLELFHCVSWFSRPRPLYVNNNTRYRISRTVDTDVPVRRVFGDHHVVVSDNVRGQRPFRVSRR